MKNLFFLLTFLLKEKVLRADPMAPYPKFKEYRAENDEYVVEKTNIVLHYITLTLTILRESISTFSHS